MALIELENIGRIYCVGDRIVRALDGVSLTVEQGEFTAVIGQSGSGKSTLMNIIGCLDRPTVGRYRLAGRELAQGTAHDRARARASHIGFVFQNFCLIPTLTALENVELALQYRGVPYRERRRRSAEMLCRVGLAERLYHRPSELSGGQQQRVALARAAVAAPPLLLADEPTGNLDADSGREVMALLHELNRDGRTVLLITHDAAVAAEAQRRICLNGGKIRS